MGIVAGHALRRRDRRPRRPADRHRPQRPDLPRRGGSAAGPAARAGARAAGHELRGRRRRRHLLRHGQPRQGLPAAARPGRRGHVPVGRARRPDGRQVGRAALARADPRRQLGAALHPLGQHVHAQRRVEPLVRGLQRRGRLPHRQPRGPLPAVEGRAARQRRRPDPAVGHRRLPAAEPAARDHGADRARPGRGLPAAVRERRPAHRGSRRPPRHGLRPATAARRAPSRRRWGAASSAGDSAPSSGRPATRTTTRCVSICWCAPRPTRRGAPCGPASRAPSTRGTRRPLPTAPTSSAWSPRTPAPTRPARGSSASPRASRSTWTTRRPASPSMPHAGRGRLRRLVRRHRRTLPRAPRRVLARHRALGGAVSARRDRRFQGRALPALRRPRSDRPARGPRHRRAGQRGHGGGPLAERPEPQRRRPQRRRAAAPPRRKLGRVVQCRE